SLSFPLFPYTTLFRSGRAGALGASLCLMPRFFGLAARNLNRKGVIMAEKLKIIPLGGLNEIGKNLTVYEYGNDIIIVDVGMGFRSEEHTSELQSRFEL